MQNETSPLVIKRITQLPDSQLAAFNSLLDEGTVWDAEQGSAFLANSDNALFVAYWAGELAGFLTAHRLQRFDHRKAEVLLYEIGVAEKFQRKGIGKALIAEVKTWAHSVGADEVWVLTNRTNSAGMSLYNSTGAATEADDEQMFVYKI